MFLSLTETMYSRQTKISVSVLDLNMIKARSKRRSIHAPNLTDELSTAQERRLNQFGSAGLVWCGKKH